MKLTITAIVLLFVLILGVILPVVLAHNSNGSDCSSLYTDWGVKLIRWGQAAWDLYQAKKRFDNAGWKEKFQAGRALADAYFAYNSARDAASEAGNHWMEHCGGG